jgi:ubiquinone/menaquinone biosynthesis C-methylase UbiE
MIGIYMKKKEIKILDLGCGKKKHKIPNAEVIGLDKFKLKGVDIVWDLEKLPLPFKKNEFDMIIAQGILEHVSNIWGLLNELHRILKPNGILRVTVPHFKDIRAYHLDHKHFFTTRSFNNLLPEIEIENYYCKAKFKVKMRINFRKNNSRISWLNHIINPFVNKFPNFWEQFLSSVIACQQLIFELEKVELKEVK